MSEESTPNTDRQPWGWLIEKAKSQVDVDGGDHLVVVLEPDSRITYQKFSDLKKAQSYADDAASENDPENPIAIVLDSGFDIVHEGRPYYTRAGSDGSPGIDRTQHLASSTEQAQKHPQKPIPQGKPEVAPPPLPPLSLQPVTGPVEYAVDMKAKPEPGYSRFLHDEESGARVWVSGRLAQNYLVYKGQVKNGLAHGKSEAFLMVGSRDHSPRHIDGWFREGLFLGDEPFSEEIIVMPVNDFLIRIPDPGGSSAQFLLHTHFAMDGITVKRCETGASRPPDLLVVAPPGLSAFDEEDIQELMKQAFRLYCRRCITVFEARVDVVLCQYNYVPDVSKTGFEPLVASATVSGRRNELQIYSYYNPEAREVERRNRQERRNQEQERAKKNAPIRGGGPDLRGLRLGMSLEQMRELFKDDATEWNGPRETPGQDDPYHRPVVNIQLKDGSTISAAFTSIISGSKLYLFTYEQLYREGVQVNEVVKRLEKKYGKPDAVKRRKSGTFWATYYLVSDIDPPDKAFGPYGAFFAIHVSADSNSDNARMLRISFNDATLGYHDEKAVHDAHQEEEREKFEKRKTDEIIL